MNFNKPIFKKYPCCGICCDSFDPYSVVFESEEIYDNINYHENTCLKCMKNEGYKIDKKLKKKLLEKQRRLQIKYYEGKLKKLKRYL